MSQKQVMVSCSYQIGQCDWMAEVLSALQVEDCAWPTELTWGVKAILRAIPAPQPIFLQQIFERAESYFAPAHDPCDYSNRALTTCSTTLRLECRFGLL